MNIASLKALIAGLRDDIEDVQFDALCDEFARLQEVKRQADKAELQATLEKAAALQAKLGVQTAHSGIPVRTQKSPKTRRQEPERDLTDADLGYSDDDDDGVTASSFRAELAALKAHTRDKRRRVQ